MSDTHVQRLRRIRDELDGVRVSVAFVIANQHDQAIITALMLSLPNKSVPLKDIEDARDALEGTYLIRLYAEFQGLLKHQLAANHPATKIPPNSNADWLVSRVLRAEGIKADPALRARLDSVRDYRNDLAHQNNVPQMLTFQEALSTLNTLVAKLSEPLA